MERTWGLLRAATRAADAPRSVAPGTVRRIWAIARPYRRWLLVVLCHKEEDCVDATEYRLSEREASIAAEVGEELPARGTNPVWRAGPSQHSSLTFGWTSHAVGLRYTFELIVEHRQA